VPSVTDSDPEARVETPGADATPETPEEKRARVMKRLAEILRADPPDVSGSGPVSAGAFPVLPGDAEEFDQQSAAELFAALGEFFQRHKQAAGSEDAESE
jgi:hypothetical protein